MQTKDPKGVVIPYGIDDDDESELPDVPLDLTGFATMQESFGIGANKRIVLVSGGISVNQLLKASS